MYLQFTLSETHVAHFWAKVQRGDTHECWPWTGALNNKGHGNFAYCRGGKNVWLCAHRVSYELLVGPIPEAHDLHHTCMNKACVNPEHLEPLTRKQHMYKHNGLFVRQTARTHCPQGHPYDLLNTRYYRGSRRCKACDRERALRVYHERKTD